MYLYSSKNRNKCVKGLCVKYIMFVVYFYYLVYYCNDFFCLGFSRFFDFFFIDCNFQVDEMFILEV